MCLQCDHCTNSRNTRIGILSIMDVITANFQVAKSASP